MTWILVLWKKKIYIGTKSSVLKNYYHLTKPGIIRGNLITALAGFLFAASGNIHVPSLLATLTGIALVIASGCVYNNILDKEIDKVMERTKKRAIPAKSINVGSAAVYATILGLAGFGILYFYTNITTVLVGFTGIIFYVLVYGYVKRRSAFGTEIGTISGATPILAGYTAVNGFIDWPAVVLFVIMAVWQMPHFYAIAIFRMKEYAKAKIPVLSVKKGIPEVKLRIMVYVAIYTLVATLPTILGYAGITYGLILFSTGLYWFYKSYASKNKLEINSWARQNFGISLLVLLIFSTALSLDAFLP